MRKTSAHCVAGAPAFTAPAFAAPAIAPSAFTALAVAALAVVVSSLAAPGQASAQLAGTHAGIDRLPVELLDVLPPSEWVRGTPGQMTVQAQQCRTVPADAVRRRIVEVAVQEWAFFGFPVLDRLNGARLLPPGTTSNGVPAAFENTTRRAPVPNSQESARVAASIAGYWAVTPEGRGIVQSQNQLWNSRGVAVRWTAPWSAAFISWVMCEAGLGTSDQFRRAIAHRTYIDQAIRARDGQAPGAAYVAYDIGERTVEPGDMLCSARRPQYRNLAERRRQMGMGASSHCDVVVAVDAEGERILAIGGNVLRAVSMKVLGGQAAPDGGLLPRGVPSAALFAHLKLRADPIENDALVSSQVMAALRCRNGGPLPARAALVVTELAVALPAEHGC